MNTIITLSLIVFVIWVLFLNIQYRNISLKNLSPMNETDYLLFKTKFWNLQNNKLVFFKPNFIEENLLPHFVDSLLFYNAKYNNENDIEIEYKKIEKFLEKSLNKYYKDRITGFCLFEEIRPRPRTININYNVFGIYYVYLNHYIKIHVEAKNTEGLDFVIEHPFRMLSSWKTQFNFDLKLNKQIENFEFSLLSNKTIKETLLKDFSEEIKNIVKNNPKFIQEKLTHI